MRKREANTKQPRLPRLVQREKVQHSPFGGLQIIADRLNDLPDLRCLVAGLDCDPTDKEACTAWALVETIVTEPSLARAARLFTEAASRHPVNMVVEYPVMGMERPIEGRKRPIKITERGETKPEDRFIETTEPPHTLVSSRDAVGAALWHLWLFYFQDFGWLRLKRCSFCQTWFVDTSKNRSTERCSDPCTWKWWNRNRRKTAGHTLASTRRKSHGLKKHR